MEVRRAPQVYCTVNYGQLPGWSWNRCSLLNHPWLHLRPLSLLAELYACGSWCLKIGERPYVTSVVTLPNGMSRDKGLGTIIVNSAAYPRDAFLTVGDSRCSLWRNRSLGFDRDSKRSGRCLSVETSTIWGRLAGHMHYCIISSRGGRRYFFYIDG